jgi:RNA polymerase sigma-70 factor (ECF subfamily)
MDDPHMSALLARWNLGDMAAAQEAILACEPYVRMVVRRRLSEQLRARFDSVDLVQSVWVKVLQNLRRSNPSFPDGDRLRGYLAETATHLLIDRLRQLRAAVAAERAVAATRVDEAAARHHERPSEVAQAEDVWARIHAICPPRHREVLELKRQGLSLGTIAERTGLHEGSIRRILYDLGKRMSLDPQVVRQPRRQR